MLRFLFRLYARGARGPHPSGVREELGWMFAFFSFGTSPNMLSRLRHVNGVAESLTVGLDPCFIPVHCGGFKIA